MSNRLIFNRLVLVIVSLNFICSFCAIVYFKIAESKQEKIVSNWTKEVIFHTDNCSKQIYNSEDDKFRCEFWNEEQLREVHSDSINKYNEIKAILFNIILYVIISPLILITIWISISFIFWGNVKMILKNEL